MKKKITFFVPYIHFFMITIFGQVLRSVYVIQLVFIGFLHVYGYIFPRRFIYFLGETKTNLVKIVVT